MTEQPYFSRSVSRRTFAALVAGTFALRAAELDIKPKVLAVVAHPDDEYPFAATVYGIVHELGGAVDQMVISNGEAGYRYSVLAEQIYGLKLSEEQVGRATPRDSEAGIASCRPYLGHPPTSFSRSEGHRLHARLWSSGFGLGQKSGARDSRPSAARRRM